VRWSSILLLVVHLLHPICCSCSLLLQFSVVFGFLAGLDLPVSVFYDLFIFLHLLFKYSSTQWIHPLFDASTVTLVLAIEKSRYELRLCGLDLIEQLFSVLFHGCHLRFGAAEVVLDLLHVLAHLWVNF